MKIEYQEASITDIIEYFVKGFNTEAKGVDLTNYEYFLDQQKGKVVFKLFLKENDRAKKEGK